MPKSSSAIRTPIRCSASSSAAIPLTAPLPIEADRRFDKLTVLSIAPLLARPRAAILTDARVAALHLPRLEAALDRISGVMIHYNCENRDFDLFAGQLDRIEAEFGSFLEKLDWVSLGGGIHFTGEGYPLDALADRLRAFADRFGVQVYLEPGEASITGTTTLELTVLDILNNGKEVAVVDSSIEAHMLDLLIYRENAKLPQAGDHPYQIAGKSCLAGEIFGEARFAQPLTVGDRISVQDAAGYTMVKKNWFNGVAMPAICIRERDGTITTVRRFGYDDYRDSLS